MTVTDTAVSSGSGNAFADVGIADADTHIVKADLVARIDAIVRQRGMTQTEAGRLLGLSQPDVSRLLRGDFREYSLERLLHLLTTLGRDIDIVIRQPRSRTGGKLRVADSRRNLTAPCPCRQQELSRCAADAADAVTGGAFVQGPPDRRPQAAGARPVRLTLPASLPPPCS